MIFQLEMSREQLGLRLMSSEALIDSRKLRTGTLNDDEWGTSCARERGFEQNRDVYRR